MSEAILKGKKGSMLCIELTGEEKLSMEVVYTLMIPWGAFFHHYG